MVNIQIPVRQKGQENFPVPLVLCLVVRWNFWFNINFFENYNATFIEHSFYPVKKKIASSRSHLATKSSWIFHRLSTKSFVENPCLAIVNPQGSRPMKILIFWGFSGPTPSHEIWESSFLTDLYTDTNFSQLYAPIWTNVNVKSSATNSQWGILKSEPVRNRQIRRFLNCYQTCQKFPPFFPKNSNFPQPCSSCSSNLLKLLHQTVPNWINKYHPNPFQNYNFKKKKESDIRNYGPFLNLTEVKMTKLLNSPYHQSNRKFHRN